MQNLIERYVYLYYDMYFIRKSTKKDEYDYMISRIKCNMM